MRAFFTTFFGTLSAFLVAAAIIGFVVTVYQARERLAALRQMTSQSELRQAQTEWNERMSRNPQFDPNGDKLAARLRQI